jgi:hypothetical protein
MAPVTVTAYQRIGAKERPGQLATQRLEFTKAAHRVDEILLLDALWTSELTRVIEDGDRASIVGTGRAIAGFVRELPGLLEPIRHWATSDPTELGSTVDPWRSPRNLAFKPLCNYDTRTRHKVGPTSSFRRSTSLRRMPPVNSGFSKANSRVWKEATFTSRHRSEWATGISIRGSLRG